MFSNFAARGQYVAGLMKKSVAELGEMFAGKNIALVAGRMVLQDRQQKEILRVINNELKKGPLGGYIAIVSVTRYPREGIAGFYFNHTELASPFKVQNRMKAYSGYLERFKKQHEELLRDHFKHNQQREDEC